MALKSIDAVMIQKMFLSGAKALEAKKEYINELNVFPVPDGDTGTNMTMTIMSAAKEVTNLEKPSMDELGKAISSGSLRGARGNSGVIMSQIFRGFVKEIKGNDTLDVTIIGNAVQHAAETAYKAVMKPKEGTILTVAKAGAEKAEDMIINSDTDDIIEFCDAIVANMEDTLLKTPDMLPVLKQAGVVDSGGEGLMTFLRGAIDALKGKVSDFTVKVSGTSKVVKASTTATEEADIKFGYCTEFIIMLEREQDVVERQLKEYLQKIGDCVVVVADDDIVKVHVHTNDPGLAIQKALTYGSLTSMKIDNMREEHHEKVIKDAEKAAKAETEAKSEPEKEVGFIAVSAGEGLSDIFKDLGVDFIIEGGQTMNPSTEDILEAVDKVNAKNIFVLPNNGNIILAAEQAKQLTENKNLIVIPSKNIPQGISAMINYVANKSVDENEKNMSTEMLNIKSGQVTYAVRDTNMDGKDIKQGDFMGLTDKTIVAVEKNVDDAATALIDSMIDDDAELVSLYYGADVDEDGANKLADKLADKYEDVEFEVQFGGQPVYSYFISVE
ncbi:MAG: DAK2 domain-containing protein [Clostridium sp.]|uniref:DAK2 domain-containing protein n=1 Tax=Butyribacter sp. TaxID=2822465 RepID=UPI002A9D01F8|nr:DAK2 domain-containing protein [Clostridium sp.]MDY5180345.1 DAK2 domain-containing protein [Butyribacter sp.]